MRRSADWMDPVDDRILESVREHGNLSPKALKELGVTSKSHACRRCRVLGRYGLLEQITRGLYGMTDEGRAYLNEELDASALEPDEDLEK